MHSLHKDFSVLSVKSLWDSFHQRHMYSLTEEYLSLDREIPAIHQDSLWLPNTPEVTSVLISQLTDKEQTQRTDNFCKRAHEVTELGMKSRFHGSRVIVLPDR